MSGEGYNIGKKVKYKVDDSISQIMEYNLDVMTKSIYLFGETSYISGGDDDNEPGVEFSMANRFIKNINILQRLTSDPILIHMKTCGGHWAEGIAIYDAIKACPNPVTILNYTHARSMSSIIFQAADKRVMMQNSTFMFHDGTFSMNGTVKQVFSELEELKKTGDVMFDIYINKMKENGKFKNKSKEFIGNWIRGLMDKKEDVYFDSKQAVEYGFADEVFGANGVYDWNSLTKYS